MARPITSLCAKRFAPCLPAPATPESLPLGLTCMTYMPHSHPPISPPVLQPLCIHLDLCAGNVHTHAHTYAAQLTPRQWHTPLHNKDEGQPVRHRPRQAQGGSMGTTAQLTLSKKRAHKAQGNSRECSRKKGHCCYMSGSHNSTPLDGPCLHSSHQRHTHTRAHIHSHMHTPTPASARKLVHVCRLRGCGLQN